MFLNRDTEAQRDLSDFFKVTWLVGGKAVFGGPVLKDVFGAYL